jgi:predicted phage tail protein
MTELAADNLPLREVVLHGELARRYGKVHHLAVRSAREAVRLLSANFPAFERELATAHERGVAYQVWAGGHNLSKDEVDMHSVGRIYISPVIMGSKRQGTLETIIGVVLIVVGVVLEAAYGAGTPVIMAGVGMLAGGISQLLAPQPKQDDHGNELKSTWFDGPVNVTAQGNPVPVLYGEMVCGSAVISAGITIDDSYLSGYTAPGFGGAGPGGGGGQWHPPTVAK